MVRYQQSMVGKTRGKGIRCKTLNFKLNLWCVTFFGDHHLSGGRRRRNRRMVVDGRAMWVVVGSRNTGSLRAGSAARTAAGRRPGVPRVGAVPRVGGGGEQSKAVVDGTAATTRSVRHGLARQL